jgi:hypothetical protein
MAKETVVHGKYIVSVEAKQNGYGVWYSEFTVVKDGTAVPAHLSEPHVGNGQRKPRRSDRELTRDAPL